MTKGDSFNQTMGRRRCLRTVLILGAGVLAGIGGLPKAEAAMPKSKVVIVKTTHRAKGIRTAMAQFDLTQFRGANVAIKANYNSADPFPASTHPDTLRTLIEGIKESGAGPMTLAERSGMGDTAHVLKTMGAKAITEEHGVKTVIMDTLKATDYVLYTPKGSNWKRGFMLARPFVEADKVVQTCCLKTHQYGGHFTLSLKNPVGAIAKYDPTDSYNFMGELHRSPKQRTLIPEISLVYRNDLIIMDGFKAFVTGGPHAGKEVSPGVIIAGTDPVAVDAVGVAILRMYETTPEVMEGKIFDQEQIKRAAELGIGARSADDIELIGMGEDVDPLVERIYKDLA